MKILLFSVILMLVFSGCEREKSYWKSSSGRPVKEIAIKYGSGWGTCWEYGDSVKMDSLGITVFNGKDSIRIRDFYTVFY